jgi:hypothetical protein
MLGAMMAAALWAAAETGDPAAAIETARRRLREGRIDDAEAILTPLAERDDPIGRIARFGLANAYVHRSETPGLRFEDRRALLQTAIDVYRGLLLAPQSEAPDRGDVLHNRMVAKIALGKLPDSQNRGPAPEVGDQPKRESAPERTASPTAAPSERRESRPAEASIPGDVRRSTPGIANRDPGPLTPDDAEKLLRKAMERLRSESQKQRRAPAPRQRGPEDI